MLLRKNARRAIPLYILLLFPVLWYIFICYAPMFGIVMAFQKFSPYKGILGSPWANPWYRYFQRFFTSPYFTRVLTNTTVLSLQSLLFGFPLPILLALCINEVRNTRYRKLVQNITYAPHFLSTIVLVGVLRSFVNNDYGIVNLVIRAFGGTGYNWLQRSDMFRPLYVGSGVWQNLGWDSIIYIAALSGVDPQLHESAMIDGANRLRRMWHINLPGILPTIIILMVLNAGRIMNVGFEKVYLMQNDLNLSTSDVIATYAYRIGIETSQFSLSTTISLFNSVVNCALLLLVNAIARKTSEISLW